MDVSCTIQDDIHGFRLVYKYVSRILGTYQIEALFFCIYMSYAKGLNLS